MILNKQALLDSHRRVVNSQLVTPSYVWQETIFIYESASDSRKINKQMRD